MTGTVVHFDPIAHARAVKARLWNPPNARQSTELDIASGSDLRRRRAAELKQRDEAKRAEADFRRQIAIDDLIREALAEHIKIKNIAHRVLVEDDIPPPKVDRIIDAAADEFGISGIDIRSQRRTADVVLPRQIAMYLAKLLTFKSLPEIGRRLGNRDHTTILHGIRRAEAWIAENPEIRAKVAAIRKKLSAQL